MTDTVRVRLLRPFRVYRRGDVLNMPKGQAKSWALAGIAVEEQQQQLVETAAASPEVRTADAMPRRKRR